jgi:hypothetical protein
LHLAIERRGTDRSDGLFFVHFALISVGFIFLAFCNSQFASPMKINGEFNSQETASELSYDQLLSDAAGSIKIYL